MTLDDVRDATREAVVAADHVAAHLERIRERSAGDFPLAADVLENWDDLPRERLHAMLRMFEQLYDLTGRRLFRGLLFLSGEDASELSARNLFRRVEALNGVASADRWIAIGLTRNRLVHEYPTSPIAQAERANLAWDDLPDLIAGTRMVVARLHQEELI